jgi:hypothetical protein
MEHKIEQRIDFKRLVIILLLSLCITPMLGFSKDIDNGLYQCSADQDGVFIINTRTGQIWELAIPSTIDFGTPPNRKTQRSYITPPEVIPMSLPVKSQIISGFDGLSQGNIYKFDNGQIWEQTDFYSCARVPAIPRATICRAYTGYKMTIDGIDIPVAVRQLK